MSYLRCEGREVYLSYSANVHPAETVDELLECLRRHVGPISRAAFGAGPAAANLRLGMSQADELLGYPVLPSTSTLSDDALKAPPTPACERLLDALDAWGLDVVSINAFPIRDFHASRVKEQVYSPPWTDGGRALYSLKIAKILSHIMTRRVPERVCAAISVPTGVFKAQYGDGEEIREQCAHFLTECVRELFRLENLTGRTVQLGLEPEPLTTGETCGEFIAYYKLILENAAAKYPRQLGIKRAQAEEIVRRFLTVNLDLCHQAAEFEDPVWALKQLKSAGIAVSGLHLAAALRLREPAANTVALAQLRALDEPRYLHQVIAKARDGSLVRFADLPDLWDVRRMRGRTLRDFEELRCHFHMPLFTDLGAQSALGTTREVVGPAARFAVKEGLTNNLVVETYTWNVLAELAARGNAGAQSLLGQAGAVDVQAGIVKELLWAREQLQTAD